MRSVLARKSQVKGFSCLCFLSLLVVSSVVLAFVF